MINTKLKAVSRTDGLNKVYLVDVNDDIVAEFASTATFYIVTGFKSAEAYNEHHADEPVKFLVWKREH